MTRQGTDTRRTPDRRDFIRLVAGGLLVAGGRPRWRLSGDGRLRARPGRVTGTLRPGLSQLGLATSGRDGVLYVPASYSPDRAAPLVLALHGAGGRGERQVQGWIPHADEKGFVVLAPDSRGGTWDVVTGDFGADVAFIDEALASVFSRCRVDAARLILGGFSDGATSALSLGLINGDLFPRVVAFSAGFVVPGTPHGAPRFFLSHGRADDILPIDQAGRRVRTQLERAGYRVTYREFDGGHTVLDDVRREAVEWMLG
jgi:phospholipase/carboxylesterase